MKTDRNGNIIGDGTFNVKYHVEDFSDYPQIENSVSLSNTTESVYVTYVNTKNDRKITCRFSCHENNAVKFGDQLNGLIASKNEILAHLGLKKRVFVPETRICAPISRIKMRDAKHYPQLDMTAQEVYAKDIGFDMTEFAGMVLKGTNWLVSAGKIEELEVVQKNCFGQTVRVGNWVYID